jgi:hypothetical protein
MAMTQVQDRWQDSRRGRYANTLLVRMRAVVDREDDAQDRELDCIQMDLDPTQNYFMLGPRNEG